MYCTPPRYTQLSKALSKAGNNAHAAFYCKAAARCERALEDPTAEADILVHGAQLFMMAEVENQDLDFGSFEENLTEAIECYLLVNNMTAFTASLKR